MTQIGVLSDTHLSFCEEHFAEDARHHFADCQIILHAGDLTDHSILKVFSQQQVFAVHGNMCNSQSQRLLPEKREVQVAGYRFGLCHGAGHRATIIDRVYGLFPEADCIVFGHTHEPLCQQLGSTLLLNPGSFMGTGRHGAPGTYAIITLDDQGLRATIHERRRGS